MQTAVYGKLYTRNVVTTYQARAVSLPDMDMNLPAVAVVCNGKYGRGIFPAVVSKARIPLPFVHEVEPSPASLYPLQTKVKHSNASLKSEQVAHNKKMKELLHDADLLAPKPYITATDSQFKSGQNVVAGGTSVMANTAVAYMFVRRLSYDLDVELRIYNVQTQNIVCSADLGYELNPEWIAQDGDTNLWHTFYKPENFIGLTWITMKDNIKIVFVVFASGKIVATGIKSMLQIQVAEQRMREMIGPYRKGNEPVGFDPNKPRTRKESTLSAIRQETAGDNTKQEGTTMKENAARRNERRIMQEMRDMMRLLEINNDKEYKDYFMPYSGVGVEEE